MISYLFTRHDMERLYTSGWMRGLTCGASGLKVVEVQNQMAQDCAKYFSRYDQDELKSKRKTGVLKPLPELTKRWWEFWR